VAGKCHVEIAVKVSLEGHQEATQGKMEKIQRELIEKLISTLFSTPKE